MEFLKSIGHPDEVMALLKFKLGGGQHIIPKQKLDTMTPTARKCYLYLNQTSRSFAAVIQALEGDLRHAVCIFYLVLRALDTVEDDMTIPLEEKIGMLQNFYKNLEDPQWKYTESKDKDRIVLEDFPSISLEYRRLDEHYREVISDICHKMGDGMSEVLQREVITLKDWNLYCHYVAGLVGIGLSRLFSASKMEDAIVGKDTQLANSMGLFLQKTNIIRDYLEDSLEKREFWPREVWSKYGKKLTDFRDVENRTSAVHCLNDLITNALEHVPDVIKYMSRIRNQTVFNFCAIPQVMAIATLAKCYNNPAVFTGVVKIRKGQAVSLMMEATCFLSLRQILHRYAKQIGKVIPLGDPSAPRTHKIVDTVLSLGEEAITGYNLFPPLYVSVAIMLALIIYNYWNTLVLLSDKL
ncbi:squalene synthase-like [Diadema antillarum]|uniref:squalene synthase-like n=1 Tax=Diadema antillarum TaxID=105358 RepID=UPI003A83CCAC